jgi:hypothetical protein
VNEPAEFRCGRCGRVLVRLASGLALACTACLTSVPASADAATPPAVTIVSPAHSSPPRDYTLAELEAMGQLSGSSLDDHDLPEAEAGYPLADTVVVGTVPTNRGDSGGRSMTWPTTVRGMPAPRFGWK